MDCSYRLQLLLAFAENLGYIYRMRLLLVFMYLFVFHHAYCQIKNDAYRLDSMQYEYCYAEEGDCRIHRISTYSSINDTLITIKSTGHKKEIAPLSTSKYVFDQRRLVHLFYKEGDHVEITNWKYNNGFLEKKTSEQVNRNGEEYTDSYTYHRLGESNKLKNIVYESYPGQNKQDTVIYYDDSKLLKFYGAEYSNDELLSGTYYYYVDDPLYCKAILYGADSQISSYHQVYFGNGGEIEKYIHGIIYHSKNDEEKILKTISFEYNDQVKLSKMITKENQDSTVTLYEYDLNGDLVKLTKVRERNGEKVEESKMLFEYLEVNGIKPNHEILTLLDENIISNLNYYNHMIDLGFYYTGSNGRMRSNLNQLPSKIIVYEKLLTGDVWRQPSNYTFFYTKY